MRLRILLIPAAASVALLAGCTGSPSPAPSPTPTTNGVELLSAEEILEAATEALGEAAAVEVAGTVGEAPLNVDMDLTFAGDNMQGSVVLFGVEFELVKVGPDVYVKAPAALWQDMLEQFLPPAQQALAPALAAELEGSWGKAPATVIGGALQLPFTVEDLLGPDAVPTPLTKGEVGELNGTQVITVTDAEDSVYSVAIEGEPYLLQIETDGEPVTFSVSDTAPTITAPSPSIDLLARLLG
jgi:hypothetical protein